VPNRTRGHATSARPIATTPLYIPSSNSSRSQPASMQLRSSVEKTIAPLKLPRETHNALVRVLVLLICQHVRSAVEQDGANAVAVNLL
jgi:hypothetical protein